MDLAARRVDSDYDPVLSRLRRSGEAVAERPEPRQDGSRTAVCWRLVCDLQRHLSAAEGDHDLSSHGAEGDADPILLWLSGGGRK